MSSQGRALTNRRTPISYAFTQDTLQQRRDTLPPSQQGRRERIFIEQVDLWRYDKEINPDAQILTGNVVFRHNNAYMYCDSALLYEQQNRFEAYGDVYITQGDSIEIFCNYLDYDGELLLARLRELVRMEQGENTLYTDSLDYDRVRGIGYYFDYGTIVDSLNTLSSVYGEYSTVTKQAVFNDEVALENPNFTLLSDTLHYDTTTKLATILGPTTIVSDSGTIHATRGVYDTELDRAYLMDRAQLESGTRWMTGDSLFYDRNSQLAELFGHVILKDTAEHLQLRGNYVRYNELTEHGIARDSAYVVEYSSPEDSLYIHALQLELSKVDSTTNLIKALENVRLYRSDVQAVSDSLYYHSADSVLHCYGHPFIWSGKSQVTGDSISLYIKDGEMDYAHIRPNAYMINQVDLQEHYNQMRGREVFAYFSNNQMDSIWTKGNAEVIYYSIAEDESTALEHLQSQSSAIFIGLEEEEITKIKFMDKTIGTITPVSLVTSEQLTYPGFLWFPEGRPTDFKDIFRITPPIPEAGSNAPTLPQAPPQNPAHPIREEADRSTMIEERTTETALQ